MALDYSAIEDAIVAVFAADAWLAIAVGHVAVIEARLRENAYIDKALIYGLARDTELPGIIVQADRARREKVTCGEHDNFVPITVWVFVSELLRTTARVSLTTIVEQVERVVEKQVTSAQAWGIAAATQVGTMRTEFTVFGEGDNFIGEAVITFDILKITSIEGV